jgi:hypothetical protein
VTLTFTVSVSSKQKITCTGVTNSAGTASCTNGDGRLALFPPSTYSVSFAGNYDYLPGSGTGHITA